GIDRPIGPGVAMVAAKYALLGMFTPLQGGDDVPDRSHGIILLGLQVELGRAFAQVVGEREPALPATRNRRSPECGQDLQSLGPGDRDRGATRDATRLRWLESPAARARRPARGRGLGRA